MNENKITITLGEYGVLQRTFEKVKAAERLINSVEYVSVGEIAAVLDIDIPRKEHIEV